VPPAERIVPHLLILKQQLARTTAPLWTRLAVSARGGGASTSQGHPRTVFERALQHENLLVAEATAREIGKVSLVEALE
jgi:hypothetical protein